MGCGGAILLLIVCVVGLGIWVGSQMTEAVEEDPVAIRARTAEIATINTPAGFEPTVGVHLDIPFIGDIGKFVLYEDKEHEAVLILADVSDKHMPGIGAEEWADEVRLEVGEDRVEGHDALEDAETKTVTHTVRGVDVTFKITTGTSPDSGKKRVIASGNFPGRLGHSFFLISADAETLSADDVTEVIQSIE
jgi:hypothetical protein